MRRLALALGLFFAAIYVAFYCGLAAKLLPEGAWPKAFLPQALWEGLFVAGTLIALPFCALLSLLHESPS